MMLPKRRKGEAGPRRISFRLRPSVRVKAEGTAGILVAAESLAASCVYTSWRVRV